MKPIAISVALKQWRKIRCLSQWDLADKSGVGYASIARIETGRQDPTISMLTKLAGAMRIRLVDLFSEPKRPALKRARGK